MRQEPQVDDAARTRRRVGPAGVLLVLLGIWVGFIPFVGPYFNYQMGTTRTWQWTHDHLWLSVLPGVAIFLGGLLIARARRPSWLGGLLALAGSVWLVIGPTLAQLWKHGQIGGGPAFGNNGLRVLEWLGFYYAAGALGILLSAYALGYFAALPMVARAARRDTRAAEGSAAAGAATAAPAARSARNERVMPDGEPVERERITNRETSAQPEAAPAGATQADGTQAGATRADGTQAAPTRAAATEAGATQAAPTEAGATQAAPTQAAPTQAAPTEAGATQAAPTEAGATQAAPAQAAPTEAGATQAGATQAEPPATEKRTRRRGGLFGALRS